MNSNKSLYKRNGSQRTKGQTPKRGKESIVSNSRIRIEDAETIRETLKHITEKQ